MIYPTSHQDNIIALIKQTIDKLDLGIIKDLIKEPGGIDPLEGFLLHCLILNVKPRHVIEFSPNKGYSTKWIVLALKKIEKENCFWTFEINKRIIPELEKNLKGLERYVSIVEGDAIVNVPKIIKTNNLMVDLCFIDSNHNAPFAKDYISNIFPLLQPSCNVIVHDICSNKKGELLSSLFDESGERDIISSYIEKHNISYSLLHRITGGHHENASLDINDRLYQEIRDITGIDFRKNNICPKTLWFTL